MTQPLQEDINPNPSQVTVRQRRKSSEWAAFKRNKLGMVGFLILITTLLVAIAAPLIMPFDPLAQDMANRAQVSSTAHWFGTDTYGRDVLSRIILGSRTSLFVGFISVFLSGIIGGFIGMIAAYKGGWLDDVLMRILESIMMIPLLLFGLMVLVALGPSMTTLIVVISIGLLPNVARMARGVTLEIKEKEYIKAAISIGGRDLRIICQHILPNVLAPILIITTLNMSTAIRIEASLSFLGVGVQPPTPTWGNMIQEGFQYITTVPGLVVYPGLALIIVSIAFNTMGDAIRDIFDPHVHQRK